LIVRESNERAQNRKPCARSFFGYPAGVVEPLRPTLSLVQSWQPTENQTINGMSMKKRNVAWSFLGGIVFGLSLALCLGAVEKKGEDPKLDPKPDWSRLKIVSYANAATGIFDPETGRIYLYDLNLERCYSIREIRALGEPMVRIRN